MKNFTIKKRWLLLVIAVGLVVLASALCSCDPITDPAGICEAQGGLPVVDTRQQFIHCDPKGD